ncbi:DUF2946 domain-containing protein [Massilia sp. UMI-21]|nr:DUF2946 domain-containing protein [Massilia sp. UMI-21]
MHILRTSLTLTRLVLAWFMLTFGVAVAAPVIAPQTLVLLCSHEGSKAVVLDADGKLVAAKAPSIDCPLCLPATAPPPASTIHLPAPTHAVARPDGVMAAHISALIGAPLPARGPPPHA